MTDDASALWSAYDRQMRGRLPGVWGVVAERDGPLVRVHYGTHGVVDHRDLSGVDDLTGLVRRTQEIFAERVEPVTWKVYSHDGPSLARALLDAGFTAGPPRSLLIADVADVPTTDAELRTYWLGMARSDREKLLDLAAAAPEQGRPMPESAHGMDILSLWHHGRPVDLVWLEKAVNRQVWSRPRSRYVVAEAAGDLLPVHPSAGFHAVAEVTTYRWAPPGEPARERPARMLFSGPEHDEIWRRFEERFEVTYETAYDGFAEPPGSVTWHMAAVEDWRDPLLREVEAVIARGLRACGRRGERLYWLKWYISGSVWDPTRAGGPGQPPWPGYSYLTDENVIQVSEDLRTGTYGNFVEESLCVWGADLVAEVQEELTRLLGTVLRRSGRPVGNVWTFGP